MSDISVFLWIAVFAILVDGIKVMVEIFCTRKKRVQRPSLDRDQVTAVVVAYNESEKIVKTIRSIAKNFKNVILADDGSTDRTAEIVKAAAPEVSAISFPHGGKTQTQKLALESVTTPYVIFFDADVTLAENFCCPDISAYTASAFNVVPIGDYREGLGLQNILIDLQKLEYAKSMTIGRRFQGAAASVHCISGAAGLFETERVKKLAKFHSGVFQGEDLERTMLELVADGRVDFCDSRVETSVPATLISLMKQRLVRWWPGLWRNLPFFLKIIFKRQVSFRLRFEMFYQFFSAILDPLKILSFLMLIGSGEWPILTFVYGLYLLLEIVIFYRLQGELSLKNPLTTLIVFPFYNLFQIFLRVGALLIYVWKRLNRDWEPVKTTITFSLLFLISSLAKAEEEKAGKDGLLQLRYESIKDSNGRSYSGAGLYLGYQDLYFEAINLNHDYERYGAGGYFKVGDVTLNPELRWRFDTIEAFVPKLIAEKSLSGNIVGRLGAQYLNGDDRKVLPQMGFDYYYGDANFSSFDVYREYGNDQTFGVLRVKNRLTSGDWKWDIGATLNTESNPGFFTSFSWKNLYVGYSFAKNLENYDFDRQTFSIGLSLGF